MMMASTDANRKTIFVRRDLIKMGLAAAGSAGLQHLPFSPRTVSHSQAGLAPDAVKRLYIAADDHTDYMWTADEAAYRQAFLDMLDFYLDAADQTAANPPDRQMRWNCDGTLWLWEYEHHRTAADMQRLISRVRSGHLSVPLNTLISVYGGMPTEAVLRGLYYAGQLERRYQLRFPLALAMENQTLPYGLGALFAGAGARYSWRGICDCATRIDAKTRDDEIYWWTGADGSRILLKWYSLTNNNMDLGGYAEARSPSAAVSALAAKCGTSHYPYQVAGAFGQGWDDLQTLDKHSFIDTATSLSNASQRVIVSNENDFFADFEATYGANLPSLGCSFGNEWDLLCASMAEVTARVRSAVEKLRSAEALAALVSLQRPTFMDTHRAAQNQAWINIGMYWEHCWSAGPGVNTAQRAAWQRRVATDFESTVNTLHADAATALAQLIPLNGSAAPRFYVFNPLSWARSDVADLPYAGATPLHVVDVSSGVEVPVQLMTVDGQTILRILADNIPPAGYKVYEIRPGAGQSFGGAPTANGSIIENEFYRLTLAGRGAITSLLDKARSNREFVRAIGGYSMNDLGAGAGTLSVENAGAVSVTLKAVAAGPVALTTRVTLVRGLNRIDIRNEITQNFGDVRQWRFGFEINTPDVWHEELGAIIRARLLADGGHYAPHNARYDWLSLNHFADISGGGVGATLSNTDCSFMQVGASNLQTLDTATPQLSALAGGQVDSPSFGIPNQDGDSYFLQRFALQTHAAFDAPAAMRFALEHQNPLLAHLISGGSGYPGDAYSLLSISNPNVLLWALKPAEDGPQAGLVARVWNLSASPATATLTPTCAAQAAQQLTHIETPLGAVALNNGALPINLAAQQLKTYALLPLTPRAYLPLVE
jgi:alpha-mannosidase